MSRQFSLPRDGAPLGMAVTLVEWQHFGNDPRWKSLQKIMLSFGAIISTTIFINRGNARRGSTPPYVSRLRSRHRITGVRKAKEFHLDWGKQDKGVTNCLWHCILHEWGFLSRSHHQTTSTPPESRNSSFSPKNWSFQCLLKHRWSASEYSTFVQYATPLQHNRPFGPKH